MESPRYQKRLTFCLERSRDPELGVLTQKRYSVAAEVYLHLLTCDKTHRTVNDREPTCAVLDDWSPMKGRMIG
jgi:hypothetical protein